MTYVRTKPLTDAQRALVDSDPKLFDILIGYCVNKITRLMVTLNDEEYDIVRHQVNVALFAAATNYRHDRGTTFRTYATAITRVNIPTMMRKVQAVRERPQPIPLFYGARHPNEHEPRATERVPPEPPELLQAEAKRAESRAKIASLPEFLREVLELRYGGATLAEAAARLGVSRLEVRRLETCALRRLGAFSE